MNIFNVVKAIKHYKHLKQRLQKEKKIIVLSLQPLTRLMLRGYKIKQTKIGWEINGFRN